MRRAPACGRSTTTASSRRRAAASDVPSCSGKLPRQTVARASANAARTGLGRLLARCAATAAVRPAPARPRPAARRSAAAPGPRTVQRHPLVLGRHVQHLAGLLGAASFDVAQDQHRLLIGRQLLDDRLDMLPELAATDLALGVEVVPQPRHHHPMAVGAEVLQLRRALSSAEGGASATRWPSRLARVRARLAAMVNS